MKKIAFSAITEYDATPISTGRKNAMIGTFANSGAILVGSLIGINLLNLTKIRVGNLLPAIFIAIVWAAFKSFPAAS